MIYHIVTAETWHNFEGQTTYVAESLHTEGFIHCCSNQAQIEGVLSRFYAGVPNLLLLHIDDQKLTSELKYEAATDVDDLFPHVFGAINQDAIIKVTTLYSE